MGLALIDRSHQPDGPDWEWNGAFESAGNVPSLRDLEGNWVELIDPILQKSLEGDVQTFAFQTEELWALAALLHERLVHHIH
jgi:hypothetical protein